MNLIKVKQILDAFWHIPNDQADLEDEEGVFRVDTMCGVKMLYDGEIPEDWIKCNADITIEKVCKICLKSHVSRMP